MDVLELAFAMVFMRSVAASDLGITVEGYAVSLHLKLIHSMSLLYISSLLCLDLHLFIYLVILIF